MVHAVHQSLMLNTRLVARHSSVFIIDNLQIGLIFPSCLWPFLLCTLHTHTHSPHVCRGEFIISHQCQRNGDDIAACVSFPCFVFVTVDI